MQVNIKKLEKSEVEITGELPAEDFEKYRKETLQRIGKDLKVPGFREGRVPPEIVEKKVEENKVLEEMAMSAIQNVYPKIIMEHKLDAIGRPEISITKLASKNPLGFKIRTAIMPEVKLPDYKKIAQKEGGELEKVTVEDEDVEKTIEQLRQMRSKASPSQMDADKKTQINADKKAAEAELPEVNDEFVKSLGKFKNVADFKAKLKENIKLEKESRARDKRRLKIIDSILKQTEIEMPQIIVEAELRKMIEQLKHDISYSGLSLEDYLKKINKTEEDLKKSWQEEAEKRAKIELIIGQISHIEKITPDEKKVGELAELYLEKYRESSPDQVKAYVRNVETNEAVFKFLEKQRDSKS